LVQRQSYCSADEYTLRLAGTPNTVNVTLHEKLNFNFIRHIAPVAGVIRGKLLAQVSNSLHLDAAFFHDALPSAHFFRHEVSELR
jgi:hypothetical protein